MPRAPWSSLFSNLSLCMKAFENVALRQLRWGLVRGCGIGDGMGLVNAPKAFAKAKAALTYKPDSIQSTPTLLLTFDIGVYEPSLHRISRSVDFEFYLGKTSMEKKTFSFGHCPNEFLPEFFGPFSRSAFLVNKKSLFLQKCQCFF